MYLKTKHIIFVVSPITGLALLQMSMKVAFLWDLIPQFAVNGPVFVFEMFS